jgi:ABC-type oligopeptide transport system substrate-binding subunit
VTLEVTTSRHIPYLLKALATINYVPLREDFVNLHGDKFAAEFNKMLFSGPFVLSSWVHGASLGFQKNLNYWNAEAVSLKSINATYITSDKRVDDPFIAATNYTSTHPYNDGRFKNQAYDRLFEFTNNSSNQSARMKAFAKMQLILFEEAVVLSTHESSDIYVQDPKIQRPYCGANWDFSWARIR